VEKNPQSALSPLWFNQYPVYFQINFQPLCRVFSIAYCIERTGENTVAIAI
jgi:hypothetical protein